MLKIIIPTRVGTLTDGGRNVPNGIPGIPDGIPSVPDSIPIIPELPFLPFRMALGTFQSGIRSTPDGIPSVPNGKSGDWSGGGNEKYS